METRGGGPPWQLRSLVDSRGNKYLNGEPVDLRMPIGAWPDEHGHRAADQDLASQQSPQRIPRRIVQVGSTWNASVTKHATLMRAWWELNPEYEYVFYADAAARLWVSSDPQISALERSAYASLKVGPQRADLFRMLYCKYMGCIYADLDHDLTRPLRQIVPPRASAINGFYWPFEWLMYEAHHPIVIETVALQVRNILAQVEYQRTNSSKQCSSPHSCVMLVTGPDIYLNGLYRASQAANCSNHMQRVVPADCTRARDAMWRRTYMCAGDTVLGGGLPMQHCNASRHWDCRTGGRRCTSDHWQRGFRRHNLRGHQRSAHFFSAEAAMLAGFTTVEHV